MASRTKSAARILPLFAAWVLAGCGAASSALPSPAHPTAAAACHALAGEGWQVAVEIDRSDTSALALVSGDSIATCLTIRSGGDFGTASLGSGSYPGANPVRLSFLTSQKGGDQFILVGRIPSVAHAVRLTLEDGTSQDTTLGDGLWLAWLSAESVPTLIEAIDSSGATIDRIHDPNGLQPND